MNKAFLMLFLSFNSTITPRPELTNKPAKSAPKDNEPCKYNSVTNKLAAQLGIKPMMELNKGVK